MFDERHAAFGSWIIQVAVSPQSRMWPKWIWNTIRRSGFGSRCSTANRAPYAATCFLFSPLNRYIYERKKDSKCDFVTWISLPIMIIIQWKTTTKLLSVGFCVPRNRSVTEGVFFSSLRISTWSLKVVNVEIVEIYLCSEMLRDIKKITRVT